MKAPRLDFSDSSASSSEDEWDVVPVSRRRTTQAVSHDQSHIVPPMESVDSDFVRNALFDTIDIIDRVLDLQEFFARYTEYLVDTTIIAAYGVGSISSSALSRFQLALMIAILKHTKCDSCFFFDPVISGAEIAIIESFGIKAAVRDAECRPFCCDTKILFFMPHCDRELYEWVLMHKLSADFEAVFVSNCFSNYTLQYPVWESIISNFSQELLLIFKADFDKYKMGNERFNPKTAERSQVVPFAAFNDLAFITVEQSSLDCIVETLQNHRRTDR